MSDLSQLIERIEKSEGADRELDVLIAEESGQVPPDMERSWNFGWWRGVRDNRQWLTPDYTASLDAVLTLVPDLAHWSVGFDKHGNRALIGSSGSMRVHTGKAATPALALCAATLRARMEVPNA